MEYVLKTESIKKRYGNHDVLKGLSMNVPKGSIYGFIGKNGAGKTTAIRIICGLQEPSGGEYSIYGIKNSRRDILTSRRRMGSVIEAPAVYQDMTATDNVKMQCSILGLPSFKNTEKLLKIVGLENTGRKKVRNFSLGMRQRLGIAVALAGSPDFLVLDEPMNGLDPEGIIEMRELILDLNRRHNITVLISSHILDELAKIATHFGFIDDGAIVKEISAAKLSDTFRKCVRFEVSDINALSTALADAGMEYSVISDSTANVFSSVSLTKLTMILSKEGCEILSAREHDETLESYYIDLIGGKGK